MNSLLISPWHFRAYLEKFAPGSMVGYRRNPVICPIANFISDVTDGCWIVIGDSATEVAGADRHTAFWIARFVELVDVSTADPFIEREEALAVLAIVEREVAQLQIPQWTASRCANRGRQGQQCVAEGRYLTCALDEAGAISIHLVCEEHWERVAIPGARFWETASDKQLLALASVGG